MKEWKASLQAKLAEKLGQEKGDGLFKKYAESFPAGYCEDYDPETASQDISFLEEVSEKNTLALKFYHLPTEEKNRLHLKLFQWQRPVPLSDVLPMLENFDLRTHTEHPYKIIRGRETIWINDFSLETKLQDLKLQKIQLLFEEAFARVYFGQAENDGFNKLILGASLSWREANILRAYAKYLHQIRFPYSQLYIERALTKNLALVEDLIQFFKLMHDPEKNLPAAKINQSEQEILARLELIPELDEDTIIRRLLCLIKATLRTNYYQVDENGAPKTYLSFKFNSRSIPDMPLPVPMYETFVYSARFEGIHLRYGKVARGGLRWSDRLEDYRTEILGLMKAQVVKNSVIVPTGAKGGFTLKHLLKSPLKEALQKEVAACYGLFIRGLLDLADNVREEKTIPPKDVVCHDASDPYLVVAADKGTATFSDLANSIAEEYGFWLGDAFASGGSAGYDHKKMGITARGAWESAKRHFRELEIDPEQSTFTVAGIGDMSGDVFGNGMLYSDNIRLIAAFDHRHIFIDPNPDPKISFEERRRLFQLPSSSWEDYDSSLISKGGGVFKRTLKAIALTPEMKKVLDVKSDSLTPDELIRAILKAPVDLLFNGGIGTYVKSSKESHADVGDRANDRCRVNGSELRCKIACEGGNLGFTQLGRVEFALNGGLVNTDFIDNSGGVDCSDHEVNLKILLNQETRNGKLSLKARNKLLASLTSEIGDLVLANNYHQALALSYAGFMAREEIGLHADYLKELESQNILNREVEYLPQNKQLMERKAAGQGLTRPELAVLLAYTKIHLKNDILNSTLVEDPYLALQLETAFPKLIGKKYKEPLREHQLKRDIIATQLANSVVNNMGITFIFKTGMETGASVADIIRAYTVASEIFSTKELLKTIQSLDYQISLAEQFDMVKNIRALIALSTRWFLQNNRLQGEIQPLIKEYSQKIRALEQLIPELMGGVTQHYLETLTEQFQNAGLSRATAQRIAAYRAIYTTLNIIEVARTHKLDMEQTARFYFAAGERLNLLWFRDQMASDTREGYWNQLAKLSLRDELDLAQRTLTQRIMASTGKGEVDTRIEAWMAENPAIIERWNKLLSMVHSSGSVDYSMFFIVIREFIRLLNNSLSHGAASS